MQIKICPNFTSADRYRHDIVTGNDGKLYEANFCTRCGSELTVYGLLSSASTQSVSTESDNEKVESRVKQLDNKHTLHLDFPTSAESHARREKQQGSRENFVNKVENDETGEDQSCKSKDQNMRASNAAVLPSSDFSAATGKAPNMRFSVDVYHMDDGVSKNDTYELVCDNRGKLIVFTRHTHKQYPISLYNRAVREDVDNRVGLFFDGDAICSIRFRSYEDVTSFWSRFARRNKFLKVAEDGARELDLTRVPGMARSLVFKPRPT